MAPLLSFHEDRYLKKKYCDRVLSHITDNTLVKGSVGWSVARQCGCAIGCTVHAYAHNEYPEQLGLPVWLAHVEDTLHENASLAMSKVWPLLFLQSIPVGVDVDKIKMPFAELLVGKELISETFAANADCPLRDGLHDTFVIANPLGMSCIVEHLTYNNELAANKIAIDLVTLLENLR